MRTVQLCSQHRAKNTACVRAIAGDVGAAYRTVRWFSARSQRRNVFVIAP